MRLSKLVQFRENLTTRRIYEDLMFTMVLRVRDNKTILKHILDVYSVKFGITRLLLNDSRFNLTWDNVLLTVSNQFEERIIFIYGPNGIHEPEFYMYQKSKKHVSRKLYRFWEDQGFCKLFTMPTFSLPSIAQILPVDPLGIILKFVGSADLLNCRLVCKRWCYGASRDAIWNARLISQIPGYTGLQAFVRSLVLIPSYSAISCAALKNLDILKIILNGINLAWIHKYNFIIRDKLLIDPNIYIGGEEPQGKKRKKNINTARTCLNFGGEQKSSVRTVYTSIAGCISGESGATCWISSESNMLKIANLKTVAGFEKKIEQLHQMMFNYSDHLYFSRKNE